MRHFVSLFLIIAFTLLGACESASERAEKHYESAVALANEGDSTRAMLELRNTLQLAPDHREARRLYADLLRQTGKTKQALAHYTDLTERYPDDGPAQLAAAELALQLGGWDQVKQHADAAAQLVPKDDIRLRVIQTNLDYRDGIMGEDTAKTDAAVEAARALIAEDPSLLDARRIVINYLLRQEEWPEALETIDAGLAEAPDTRELYDLRLMALNQLGRNADVTAQLEDMLQRFPDDPQVPQVLVRWYVNVGDLDAAEALLRSQAKKTPDKLEPWQQLLAFLSQTRGQEAVAAELDQLIAENGDNILTFQAMRAALDFQTGQRDKAISDLEALLSGLPEEEANSAIANDIRVDLARMQTLTGNNVRARELVDNVLQADPNHTAALKMLAGWQIEDDKVDDAIVTLRNALRDAPRDPQLMTLMASAHKRAGEPELEREMLALAVDASGKAPAESLRYAANLIADGRYGPAETVLVEALRLAPNNVDLLAMLAQDQIAAEDWGRAEQTVAALEKLGQDGNAPAARAADGLRAQLLATQQRSDELTSYLEELANDKGNLAAEVALIRKFIADGEMDKARARLDALMAKDPDNPSLQFVDAAMKAAMGAPDEAAAGFEALIAKTPQDRRSWLALYRLNQLQGDTAAANAVLDRALEALPQDPELLVARAGVLERAGDTDGAILIYEDLYARNSSNELVANNLASLLSTYRTDPETLERAYQIARRLQASQVPAFRETYGWIAARLGRYDEAVEHLAVAAKAYPTLALAQYHYAVALAGAERNAEALEIFRKIETLDLTSLPEADRAAVPAEIERLSGLVGTSSDAAGTTGDTGTGDGAAETTGTGGAAE